MQDLFSNWTLRGFKACGFHGKRSSWCASTPWGTNLSRFSVSIEFSWNSHLERFLFSPNFQQFIVMMATAVEVKFNFYSMFVFFLRIFQFQSKISTFNGEAFKEEETEQVKAKELIHEKSITCVFTMRSTSNDKSAITWFHSPKDPPRFTTRFEVVLTAPYGDALMSPELGKLCEQLMNL